MLAGGGQQDEFVIHAASDPADHRTQVLKQGETFGVFNRTGDIEPHGVGEHGLYHAGTRHLSRLSLRIQGQRPLLLGSTVTEDNVELLVDLTNAEIAGESPVPQYTVHVLRERLLRDATCFERVVLVSHAPAEVRLDIEFTFDADFRDIFEVRGLRRPQRGKRLPARVSTDEVVLGYDGLDGVIRTTAVHFTPVPTSITDTTATFALVIAPHASTAIELAATCTEDSLVAPPQRVRFHQAEHHAIEAFEESEAQSCRIETSNRRLNAWLDRASADLTMMTTESEHGAFIYAGVPWFSAPFGRDALITAMETLTVRPALSAGVLRYLAATQADAVDPVRDAEPGKILHEARRGEMAALGEIPFGRYYGSVDATPLFVMLAGAYARRTGDDALIDEIWPQITCALQWIAERGDRDGDGFLDYQRESEHGLLNQGWKDSYDSVSHADGSLATGPIALCEVQAYVFGAWRAATSLALRRGDLEAAAAFRARATALKRRFDREFWQPEIQSYALALDGDRRPCRVRSSNAGHALLTRIAPQRRAPALARTLFAPDMFSGWGVRTLGATASRFNPMSYHNGSVWRHDNALIARGLARYGRKAEATAILTALYESSQWFEGQRLPELFCGIERRSGRGPTVYPVACSPQSWASGAPFMLIDACLGLEIDGRRRTVRLQRPVLPPFIDELTLHRLRIGDSSIDLRIRRHRDEVSVEVNRRAGDVRVTVVE